MNRLKLWVHAVVGWWIAATMSGFVLSGVWVAVTSDPAAWLIVALLLPVAMVAGAAASALTRDAREAR